MTLMFPQDGTGPVLCKIKHTQRQTLRSSSDDSYSPGWVLYTQSSFILTLMK